MLRRAKAGRKRSCSTNNLRRDDALITPQREAMNYRHAFHAGNFADVVKHAVLARIVAYLKEKPAAFRVLDTHAGAGLYDLSGAEASRTGEWREGIGKLIVAELAPALRAMLAPYL